MFILFLVNCVALILSVTVCVCVYVCVRAHMLSCSVVSDSLADHSLPGSSVHEIFQARMLEWVAISFSRGSSRPRLGSEWNQGWNQGLLHCRQIVQFLSHQRSPSQTITRHSSIKLIHKEWQKFFFFPLTKI